MKDDSVIFVGLDVSKDSHSTDMNIGSFWLREET